MRKKISNTLALILLKKYTVGVFEAKRILEKDRDILVKN